MLEDAVSEGRSAQSEANRSAGHKSAHSTSIPSHIPLVGDRVPRLLARGFEVCLGLLLSLEGLFLVGVFLAWLVLVLRGGPDQPPWQSAVVVLASGLLAWWCLTTAYHLITGRERRHGGLLSPLVLVLAGTACLGIGVVLLVEYGMPAAPRAVQFGFGGFSLFGLAHLHARRRRNRRAA